MFSDSTPQWYAVRVKSNRERVTANALAGKDLEVLLPAQQEMRSSLFPGYLFCRFDVQRRLPVLTVPGVVHIVSFGNVPAPVDPVEIAGVKAMIESPLKLVPFVYPAVGRRVEIQTGPLRGIEGIILAHKGEDKLVVSVSLLQRSIAVAVERDWIAPAASLSRAGV